MKPPLHVPAEIGVDIALYTRYSGIPPSAPPSAPSPPHNLNTTATTPDNYSKLWSQNWTMQQTSSSPQCVPATPLYLAPKRQHSSTPPPATRQTPKSPLLASYTPPPLSLIGDSWTDKKKGEEQYQ